MSRRRVTPFVTQAWKAAGLAEWTNNVLRHSFASYHPARHQDAPRLAMDMGQGEAVHDLCHYREIVTPDEAERYWEHLSARAG